jgi:hypothetical protein
MSVRILVYEAPGWTSSLQPVALIAPRDNYGSNGRLARFLDLSAFINPKINMEPFNNGDEICVEDYVLVNDSSCPFGVRLGLDEFCFDRDHPSGDGSTPAPDVISPTSFCFGGGTGGGPGGVINYTPAQKVWRLQARLSDGSTHEFRKDDKIHDCADGLSECISHPSGTYLAVDGSRMRIEKGETQSDSSVRDVLYLPNGDRYLFPVYEGSSTPYYRIAEKFVDHNGNLLDYILIPKPGPTL